MRSFVSAAISAREPVRRGRVNGCRCPTFFIAQTGIRAGSSLMLVLGTAFRVGETMFSGFRQKDTNFRGLAPFRGAWKIDAFSFSSMRNALLLRGKRS